jgi:hypothetical protein
MVMMVVRGLADSAAAERAEQERQRQDRGRATARAVYVDSLVERVEEVWQGVDGLIATMRTTDYDTVVQLLRVPREPAARGERLDNFAARFEQPRAPHAKATLLERLASARRVHAQIAVSTTRRRARDM